MSDDKLKLEPLEQMHLGHVLGDEYAPSEPDESASTHDIIEIENELGAILSTDRKAWVRMAELMGIVEREKLWSPVFASFTQWVGDLAKRNKVHVSVIWERKKAGKVYAEYSKRAAKRGEVVPDLQDTNLSPQNLSYIAKIAGTDTDMVDNLIKSVADGEIPKEQLKEAWKLKRAAAEKRGEKAAPSNAYDRAKREQQAQEAQEAQQEKQSQSDEGKKAYPPVVTADDILVALSTSGCNWYPYTVTPPRDAKIVFKVIPEFPVVTGSSHHARRIDAVVVSNRQCDNREVRLIGVEIKVDKHDLLNDHKAQEYADYVDQAYFAVPNHLVDLAKTVLPEGWGILAWSSPDGGALRVAVEAQLNPGLFREKSLMTAFIKQC